MAPKFKAYLTEMYAEHKQLFDNFEKIHANYALNKTRWQQEFNEEGRAVMRIVEEWENKLCTRMEKGKYSNYSHKLGDKFRQELRTRFPLIDFVGITITKSPRQETEEFKLTEIKFS